MVTTPTFWGDEVTVSSDPNAFRFSAKGLADNNFTIVWSDLLGDIHGRRFEPLGSFNSTDFLSKVSNATAENLRLPELTQQENGTVRVFYSYLASSADEDIYANFVDFDAIGGSAISVPVVETAKDEFKLGAGSTEFNNSPNSAVVYTQLRGTTQISDLYLAQLTPSGLVIGSPLLVPINTGETVTGGTVTGLPNGNTLVSYQVFKSSTSQNFTRYRVYDDYTDLTGAQNAALSPGDDAFPAAVALQRSSDGFVIATQDPFGINYRYHAFGQVFTRTVPDTTSSGGGAFPKAISPKITALNDQGFIIAWTDTTEIEGDGSPALKIGLHRFDKDGNSVGNTLYINSPGDQSLNSITTLKDGRVLLTYDNETGDSTNTFTHDYRIIDPRESTILGTYLGDNIVGREDGSTILGYEGADTLIGRAAADKLDGGAGIDTMTGAGGNDTYVVDNAADKVIETAGGGSSDTVMASASYTLASSADIELLRAASFTSTTPLNLTGNALAQKVYGNAGANVLDGKGGADIMQGFGGSDTYIVDDSHDKLIEAANGGSDLVKSLVTYTLGANVENLTLIGTSSVNATGNTLGNHLTGNNGANILAGGLGNDMLNGGAGKDAFLFNTALGPTNVDHITPFSVADDTIRLENGIFKGLSAGTLKADAFKDIAGGAALDTSDRILYDHTNGRMYYDPDGSGSAAKVQFVILDNHPTLTFHDILIV